MHTLIQIAWRNIWRNRSRSMVLITAIAIGVMAGISVSSLSNGMVTSRFDRMLENEIGHIQVHHPGFRAERDAQLQIQHLGELESWLEEDVRVDGYTSRIITDGMAQSPVTAAGVQITGIHPSKERHTTGLDDLIEYGEFFGDDSKNYAVIGYRLARKLSLETDDRLVLSFQDIHGNLVSSAFEISGIIRSVSPMLDERIVFVHTETLGGLTGAGTAAHEIIIRLEDLHEAESVTDDMKGRFSDNSILTWYERSPELYMYSQTGNIVIYIVMGVIMLALAFGILNTMLMSIHERFREIGILMAVGMNKGRVFGMITAESVMLTLTGALTGMALSVFTIWLMSSGVDFGFFGEGMTEFGFDTVVYPEISPVVFFFISLMVMFTAIIAAVYPAWKALGIPPAQAIRD